MTTSGTEPGSVSSGKGLQGWKLTYRVLHGIMGAGLILAYITSHGEVWRAVHLACGYTVIVALGCRLGMALFGPPDFSLKVLRERHRASLKLIRRDLPVRITALISIISNPISLFKLLRTSFVFITSLIYLAIFLTLIAGLSLDLGLAGESVWFEMILSGAHEFTGKLTWFLAWVHLLTVCLVRSFLGPGSVKNMWGARARSAR